VTACACESSLCHHADECCPNEGSTPAPVQYLYGELMCPECIAAYIAAGYGVNEDGSRIEVAS
jgi:hypothetical protein